MLSPFVAVCYYKSDVIFEMDSTLFHGKHVSCVKAVNFGFSIYNQLRFLKEETTPANSQQS